MAPSPTGLQVLPHSVELLAEEALAASPRPVNSPIFWQSSDGVFLERSSSDDSTETLRFPQSRGVLGDTAAAEPFWMLDHSGGIFPRRTEPGLF